MKAKSTTAPFSGLDDQTVIHLEHVSVVYRLPRERLSGLKEYAIRFLQRRLEYHEFWALRDVSFDVQRGEVFGVIGRNGAGKSTLLKVIAKVLFPTEGRLVMRGRVAPLLEIGAGFQPELTGRENVFLNSTLLGRSHKQTESMFSEILDFAELEEFIDAPLRTYSTGMVARLGFSVATCLRPEILLVDEVLSVGDAQFQQKCMDRMYSFLGQGTTILIVSHGMGTIESFCNRAVWLHNGRVEGYGEADEVARQYVQRFRPKLKDADLAGAAGEAAAAPFPEEPELEAEDSVPALDLPPVPAGPAEPTWSAPGDFLTFPDREAVYPVDGVAASPPTDADRPALDVHHGSLTAWVRFRSDRPLWGGMIFHSDDSRYVMFTGIEHPDDGGQPIPVVTARAGGNHRMIDPFYGAARFPEVTVKFRGSFPLQGTVFNEWHLLCLTWLGYPEGRLRLYVDGLMAGETTYDPRHDNHYPLASQVAIGYRPPEWAGELVRKDDGTEEDLRPQTTASIANGGTEVHAVRLYRRELNEAEIAALAANKP